MSSICVKDDEVLQTYIAIISAISERAKVVLIGPELPDDSVFPPECRTENIIRLAMPTNDTWTRDYGPLTVADSEGKLTFRDYIFNGWGQKWEALVYCFVRYSFLIVVVAKSVPYLVLPVHIFFAEIHKTVASQQALNNTESD